MKASEDFSFMGSDPGAVKYGNFINYYSFHSVEERIKNLHPEMFPLSNDDSILCLDIGCNTGELTKQLYSYLKTIYPNREVIQILAVDIDPVLTHRAQETNTNSDITYLTVNVMNNGGREAISAFLNSHGRKSFDITFCFSVTMWIHLNNGDKGLHDFLKYMKKISKTIIIEPQPWSCYRNAQRRVKKSGSTFSLYDTLKIRGTVDEVIENILIDDNSYKKVYESSASSWKRKIQSFKQQLK